MKLEEYLKSELGYRHVQKTGRGGGGCISQGETFLVTSEGTVQEEIYVKGNKAAGVSYGFWLQQTGPLPNTNN
jgi:hypothetical protein